MQEINMFNAYAYFVKINKEKRNGIRNEIDVAWENIIFKSGGLSYKC